MKNKINFLWHTALSMLDIGSSLIYNLLGRNLDSTDIELIEQLFGLMSIKTSSLDDLNSLIQFEKDNSHKITQLIERLNKGKDILLVGNKTHGCNLLQLSVLNLLAFSFSLFDFDDSADFVSAKMKNDLFMARLNIVSSLLAYGCDPNRGLVLLNKSKLLIKNSAVNEKAISTTLETTDLDASLDDNEQSENQTVITTLQTIIQQQNETKSLSSLLDTNQNRDEFNLDPTGLTNPNVNNTPIDTPLLLVSCLYSCHNLLNYHNLSSTESAEMSLSLKENSSSSSLSTCLSDNIKKAKLAKRRHTIHSVNNQINNKQQKRHFGSFCVKNLRLINQEEEKLDWPSLSIDRYSSTNSEKSFNKSESSYSTSSCDSESVDSYNYSTSSVSSLTASSASSSSHAPSKFKSLTTNTKQNTDNTSPNKLNKSSEFSDCLDDDNDEEEDEDEFADTSKLNQSNNIYNYDLDDQNYFDKYEYDIESKCCKLFSNDYEPVHSFANAENCSNFDSDVPNLKLSSLSTSVFSIPSSSIHTCNPNLIETKLAQTLTRTSELSQINLKQKYIYENLNKKRLELLDMLLDYGADKYLVAKLSESTLRKMSKKSLNILKKWFGNGTDDSSIDDLKPISPIMASICLDDVEVFSRLYKHHQNLFNYFKPDEDYELIYYAIRFQSKKCLIYLLTHSNSDETNLSCLKNSQSFPTSLNNKSHQLTSNPKSFDKINKNTNTMFYILENTRSSKIVSVLLKCGFDLCKREPFTGNTALHCLFNANSINNRLEGLKNYGIESPQFKTSDDIISNLTKREEILKEFNTPRSLSKILFKLLKHGGLKSFVNTLNYENKCCMQVLFEWNELIDLVFFENQELDRLEWKREFEECVKLLLKSGADLFDTSSDINCILTLMNSILKDAKPITNETNELDMSSHVKQPDQQWIESRSPSLSIKSTKENRSPTSRSSQIFATAKELLRKTTRISTPQTAVSTIETKKIDINKLKRQSQLNRRFDIKFFNNLITNVIDLNRIIDNLTKKKYQYYHYDNLNETTSLNLSFMSSESLISKFIELILSINLDEFELAFKTFKILCRLDKHLYEINKTQCKKKPFNYVSPSLVKTLITNWILNPNLFSSSRQFDKNHFVKSILVHLISNEMYDPNDCSTAYNVDNCLVSNNLLNHCVKLIFKSKTGYQLELIYDLMRTLIQYGANPNLEPYELVEKNFFKHLEPNNDSLSENQVECSLHRPQSPKSNCILAQLCDCNVLQPVYKHHHHYHHHKHNCQKSNQSISHFNDFEKSHYRNQQQHHHDQSKYYSLIRLGESTNDLYQTQHKSTLNTLLLTPCPSNDSLISLSNQSNTLIDKSVLFLNHYKKFVKLLYDSMDNNTIKQSLKNKKFQQHRHHGYLHSRLNSSTYSLTHTLDSIEQDTHNESVRIYSIESLDMYLERLASTPRSLKSIVRRHILNRLINSSKSDLKSNSIAEQVAQFPLPKRIMDYLLFIE